MPPFQYDRFQSPYANSLAALQERGGEIPAQAVMAGGAAHARAAELGGQAFGGAVQQIGQAVGGTIQRATDPRLQTEQLHLVETRKAILEHDAFKAILKSTPQIEENGMHLWDLPSLADKSVKAGLDPSTYLVEYGKVNDAFRQENQARLATVQLGAQALMRAPDPDLAVDFLSALEKNRTISSEQASRYKQIIAEHPDKVGAIAAYFAGPQKPIMGKEGETPLNPITAAPMGPTLPKTVILPRPGAEAVQTGGADGPKVLATAPQGPPTAGEVDAAAQALYTKRAAGETLTPAETASLAGYEARKGANDAPITIKTVENGKMVERVMSRADALAHGPFPSQPPAAIQINTAATAASANAPLVDASRPSGPNANKINPATGLTPNAEYQGAMMFALEGKMPPAGMGSAPRAVAARTAYQNKAGAIAAAAGTDLPTVQAEYRANSTALNKLLPQAKATASFANTATDNLQLALDQSPNVARTGSKLANHYLQWVQGNFTSSTDLGKFETYIYTAAREYAKVTSGGALSAAGLTDSAAKEAEKLVNAAQSPERFAAVTEAMKADMANVISNQSKTLAGISNTIANFFSVANGGGAVQAPQTPQKPDEQKTKTDQANAPATGTLGMLNGKPVVWQTRDGVTGWWTR